MTGGGSREWGGFITVGLWTESLSSLIFALDWGRGPVGDPSAAKTKTKESGKRLPNSPKKRDGRKETRLSLFFGKVR